MIGWYGCAMLCYVTPMMMLIPGVRREGEVARFHLTGGLTDPQKN